MSEFYKHEEYPKAIDIQGASNGPLEPRAQKVVNSAAEEKAYLDSLNAPVDPPAPADPAPADDTTSSKKSDKS